MNKKPRPATMFFLMVFVAGASWSQILTIQEIDREGSIHATNAKQSKLELADINSTLRISIDVDQVRKQTSTMMDRDLPFDVERLDRLTATLEKQAELLALVGTSDLPVEKRRENLQTFSREWRDVLKFANSSKTMRPKVVALLGEDRGELELLGKVFTLVRTEVEEMATQIGAANRDRTVTFSLSGEIIDRRGERRRVHIPEFDSFAEGEFFEVPRFVMPTSAEVQASLQQASKIAGNFNQKGLRGALDLQAEFASLANGLSEGLGCVSQAADALLTSNASMLAAHQSVEKLLKKLQQSSKNLLEKTEKIKSTAEALQGSPDPLEQSIELIPAMQSVLKEVEVDLHALAKDFVALAKDLDSLSSEVDWKVRIAEAESCVTRIRVWNDRIKPLAEAAHYWVELDVPQGVKANLALDKEITRFLLDDIPTTTDLDLRYTGKREPGDEIELLAAIEPARVADGPPVQAIELESRRFSMEQIGWHANLSVGIVFMDPETKESVKLTRQFQAAPSYSVLLRRGKRDSIKYTRFWNIGLGLNVAAPDFNLDTTPEIAFGLVLSTAKDYLQGGGGRNIGTDAWYWFFGVRLPVGASSFPAAGETK